MISLKQLAKYCRDYIDLVSPSVLSRDAKKVAIPKQILDATPLYSATSDFDYENPILPLALEPKLTDIRVDEEGGEPEEQPSDEELDEDRRKIEIAKKLDEINTKYETSSYTKQVTLRFGRVNFEARPITERSSDQGEVEPAYKQVEQHLFSVPVTIAHEDKGGLRHYRLLVDDPLIETNIKFLKEFLPQENRDEIFRFISESEAEEKTHIPLNASYVDELWTKIRHFLLQAEAKRISEVPDMENTLVILLPKANYFLSQDLQGIIDAAEDEQMLTTSLSAWVDDKEMSINEPVSDSGEQELFFPFPYDRWQLQVLGKLGNKAAVVEGPPGTGKSQTISNILCHLAANDKKVLFVSQKDQAVRGVKDKLKELEIPFLFGYLPDKSSRLHTDEDEKDSAAYALKGIAQAHFRQVQATDPKQWLHKLYNDRPAFDAAVGEQRDYFSLYEEWLSLDQYDFGDDSPSINEAWLTEIDNHETALHRLTKEKAALEARFVHSKTAATRLQASYEEASKNSDKATRAFKAKWDYPWLENEEALLRGLSYEEVSESMQELMESFDESVYDRKTNFIRSKLNNIKLRRELDQSIEALPREMYESLKLIVFSDETKTERYVKLGAIADYFTAKNQLSAQISSIQEKQEVSAEESNECVEKLKALTHEMKGHATEIGKLRLDDVAMGRIYRLVEDEGAAAFAHIRRREELNEKLEEYKATRPNEINEQIMRQKQAYKAAICGYLQNRLALRAAKYSAIKQYRSALESIGRKLTMTKKAYKTFDTLKSNPFNFEAMSGMIPIWMMGLEDASRVLPLAPNLFDYVIIDEASQCNISYALPAMFRSQHTIFFGDTLQMRDSTVMFKSNDTLLALANKHKIPDDLQIKAEEDSVKSVMDIAKLAGFQTTWLQNHYRSPKELIGFSNDWFYEKEGRRLQVINDELLVMDDGRVLKNHIIKPNPNAEVSAQTNLSEAVYIRKLIADIKADHRTKGKSIAVLTFLNEQADLLRRVIPDEDVKVSTIEGIQGDERDIVIYSLVIKSPEEKSRYTSLTGEGGAIKASVNAGRVNVAFSRAKLQVHTVTSLAPNLWPEKIWIKRYLEYVEKNGRVTRLPKGEQHFDSKFEEQVYDYLFAVLDGKKYSLHTQVESCGFRIDLVVNNLETGKKLAIESDGPTHFEAGDGQVRVENDYERQGVLETAGWRFYRVSFIDWQKSLSEAKRDMLEYITEYMKERPTQIEQPADTLQVNVYDEEEVEIPEGLIDQLKEVNKPAKRGAFGRKVDIETTEAKKPAPKQVTQVTIDDAVALKKPEKKPSNSERKPASKPEGGEFEELAEVVLGRTRSIVISRRPGGSLWLNEKVDSDTFKGFTHKGFGVQTEELDAFIRALNSAIGSKSFEASFERSSDMKLVVHTPDQDTIDIRYFKTSSGYTGYMKKGIRMMRASAIKLRDQLQALEASIS